MSCERRKLRYLFVAIEDRAESEPARAQIEHERRYHPSHAPAHTYPRKSPVPIVRIQSTTRGEIIASPVRVRDDRRCRNVRRNTIRPRDRSRRRARYRGL